MANVEEIFFEYISWTLRTQSNIIKIPISLNNKLTFFLAGSWCLSGWYNTHMRLYAALISFSFAWNLILLHLIIRKTHLTLHPLEWDCIYLFSDVQNCVVIDVSSFVCFRHFEIEPLTVLFKIAGLWFLAILMLIGWYLHTHPQLLPNLEKRVIYCQKVAKFFALVVTLRGVSGNFPFYKSVFDHVGSTSSF